METNRVDYQTKDGFDTRAKWEDMLMFFEKPENDQKHQMDESEIKKEELLYSQLFFFYDLPKKQLPHKEIKIIISNQEVAAETFGIIDTDRSTYWFPPIPIFFKKNIFFTILIDEIPFYKGQIKKKHINPDKNKQKALKLRLKTGSEENLGNDPEKSNFEGISKLHTALPILQSIKEAELEQKPEKQSINNSSMKNIGLKQKQLENSTYAHHNYNKSLLKKNQTSPKKKDIIRELREETIKQFDSIENKGILKIYFEEIEPKKQNFYSFEIQNLGLNKNKFFIKREIQNPKFRLSFKLESNTILHLCEAKHQFSFATQSIEQNEHNLIVIHFYSRLNVYMMEK